MEWTPVLHINSLLFPCDIRSEHQRVLKHRLHWAERSRTCCAHNPIILLYHSTSQLTFMHCRWKDIWARHVQNAVFVVVLCEYTRSQKLLSIKECSETIGCTLVSCKFSSSPNNSPPVQSEWKDRVYLQVEDYLHGLVSVVNELSRLAVNSVTLHNYEEPFRISGFVKDVFAGFSMVY
jgi:hypothetical protein